MTSRRDRTEYYRAYERQPWRIAYNRKRALEWWSKPENKLRRKLAVAGMPMDQVLIEVAKYKEFLDAQAAANSHGCRPHEAHPEPASG